MATSLCRAFFRTEHVSTFISHQLEIAAFGQVCHGMSLLVAGGGSITLPEAAEKAPSKKVVATTAGAAQGAIQSHPEWRRRFLHLAMRRQRSLAKVAMARRLAVALYWMWRNQQNYQQASEFGSHVGQPVSARGVQ